MAGPTKAYYESEARALRAELENLKKTVQTRIAEAIESGEICRSGGIDALQQFGLELPQDTWSGYIDYRVWIEDVKAGHDTYGGIDTEGDVEEMMNDLHVAIENAVSKVKLPGSARTTYIEQDDYDWSTN